MHTFEKIGSLYRYYLRADRIFEHIHSMAKGKGWLSENNAELRDEILKENPNTSRETVDNLILYQEASIYLFLAYSLLYVVIEGYKKLRLTDPKIDSLLKSPNTDLLRRFRNCLFHYQTGYVDKRISGLLEARGAEDWIKEVHTELGKFLFALSKEHLAQKKRSSLVTVNTD